MEAQVWQQRPPGRSESGVSNCSSARGRFDSDTSECSSLYADSLYAESEASSCVAPRKNFFQVPFQSRKPLREAKIVFAEEFSNNGDAASRHVRPSGAADVTDLLQADPALLMARHRQQIIDKVLMKEQSRSLHEIATVAYDDVMHAHDDVLSEQGDAPTKVSGVDPGAFVLVRRPVWVKWLLTLLISVVVALQCASMLLVEIHMTRLKLDVVEHLYRRGYRFAALGVLLGYGVLAAGISACLVLFFSPRAASSGIPDIKAFLNGNRIPGVLSFRTWLNRSVCLVLVTSAGLFAGSEGPLMAHIAAIMASGIARGRFTMFGRRFRMPWRLSGHRTQCEFAALGAALGVSGAFGSPVGGVLFSLEEASTYWSAELTWRTFFGSALAAMIARSAKTGFTDFPLASFIEFPDATADFQAWELFPFTFIGVLTGFIGAFFCRGCGWIGKTRAKFFTKDKPRTALRLIEVLLIAVVILVTCSLVPFAGGCTDLRRDDAQSYEGLEWHVGDLVRGHCQEGQYSDFSTLLMNPKHAAIKALFTKSFHGGAHFSVGTLLFCCVMVVAFTLACNGMAMPFGLFVPHIMSGGCLGRAVGELVLLASGDDSVHPGIYALVGAAGQLSGISRMTMSLTMIMVEITCNMRLMLPVMLCIMVSKAVADPFGPNVFNVALGLNKQIKMLEGDCLVGGEDLVVLDICSTEVVVLHCQESVGSILELLSRTKYQGFPLVEGQRMQVVGLILRQKLLCAIAKYREEDPSLKVDLTPFASLTPEVKVWQTPASRVFTHFQASGIQHLCIIDNEHGLMGIVTRTDLASLQTKQGREDLRKALFKRMEDEEKQGLQQACETDPSAPMSRPLFAPSDGESSHSGSSPDGGSRRSSNGTSASSSGPRRRKSRSASNASRSSAGVEVDGRINFNSFFMDARAGGGSGHSTPASPVSPGYIPPKSSASQKSFHAILVPPTSLDAPARAAEVLFSIGADAEDGQGPQGEVSLEIGALAGGGPGPDANMSTELSAVQRENAALKEELARLRAEAPPPPPGDVLAALPQPLPTEAPEAPARDAVQQVEDSGAARKARLPAQLPPLSAKAPAAAPAQEAVEQGEVPGALS